MKRHSPIQASVTPSELPGSGLLRRGFMKASAGMALGATALGSLTACGSGAAEDEVVVLGWSDYVGPEIAAIMKKGGVTMRGVPAENDQDMFTKLKAGGAGSYDIVFANCGWSPSYYKAGLIEAFDITEVPGWDEVWPIFREDTTFPYVIEPNKVMLFPNMWESFALIWNREVAFQPPKPYSWSSMWDPEIPNGKVIFRGGPEEFLAISGLSLGVPRDRIFAMNGVELHRAAKHLADLKPFQIGASDPQFDGAVRTGKAWIGQASSLAAAARANRAAGSQVVGTAIPVEGSLGWVDGPQLVKGTKKRDLALKFMEVWNGRELQTYLYDTYQYPQCNQAATERVLKKGGEGAKNLRDHAADDPNNAKKLLFMGPPDDPAAWTQAYDQVVGG